MNYALSPIRTLLFVASLLIPSGVVVAQPDPITLESPNAEEGGNFGIAVSGVPDVDGDGRGDIVVGAWEESGPVDSPVSRAGRVYIFSGATGTLHRTLVSLNPELGGGFGISVAGVPDTNGDGRGDVLVGAWQEDLDAVAAGRAYLFSGATGGLLHTLVSPDPMFNAIFGFDVASVPDIDGDGRGDVVVGGRDLEGAHTFSGATGALIHSYPSPSGGENWGFGEEIAGVPDVDGDGSGDIVFGVQREDAGTVDAGRAYVYSGATGMLIHTLDTPNTETGGRFGNDVSGIPDVDGDGRGDIIVGAHQETDNNVGRAYVFSGATGNLLHTLLSPDVELEGRFGDSVSGLSDIDGDGRGDVIVGSLEDAGAVNAGRVYVFSGATGDLLHTFVSPNAQDEGGFGGAGVPVLAGVPDADGDGRADILIGAPYEDEEQAPDAGRAYLFSGAVATAIETGTPSFVYTLETPYPNPARAEATVTIVVERATAVRLEVFDTLGRRVAALHDGPLAPGRHTLRFSTEGLPAGAYYVRALGDDVQQMKPFVLVR